MAKRESLSKMNPTQLTKRRYELIQELSKFERELQKRRRQRKIHLPASEVVWKKGPEVLPTDLKALFAMTIAPELGFDVTSMEAFLAEIPPGLTYGLSHRHGEAIKFYLSGRAVELVGDKEYHVGPGDFIFIPANTWHGTQNPYKEPARFMAVAQQAGSHVPKAAPYISKYGI